MPKEKRSYKKVIVGYVLVAIFLVSAAIWGRKLMQSNAANEEEKTVTALPMDTGITQEQDKLEYIEHMWTEDLDGDGKLDNIYVRRITSLDRRITVKINEVYTVFNGQYAGCDIIDLDRNDNVKELVISLRSYNGRDIEYPFTIKKFLSYRNSEIHDMGTIDGVNFKAGFVDGELTVIKESGLISNMYYTERYIYNKESAMLEKDEEKDYYYTYVTAVLKKDLKLQKSREDRTVEAVVPKDETVIIEGCDNAIWCLCRTYDEDKGWFEIKDGWLAGINEGQVSEVFEFISIGYSDYKDYLHGPETVEKIPEQDEEQEQ